MAPVATSWKRGFQTCTLLKPKNTWAEPENYEARARDLAEQFQNNFAEKYADVAEEIRAAGPKA